MISYNKLESWNKFVLNDLSFSRALDFSLLSLVSLSTNPYSFRDYKGHITDYHRTVASCTLAGTRSCKAGDNFGLFMTSNDVALGLGLVVVCLFNVISYNKLESWSKFVLNDLSF